MNDPTAVEDFEQLVDLIVDLDRQHGIEGLPKQHLRALIETEAVVDEEAPTMEY